MFPQFKLVTDDVAKHMQTTDQYWYKWLPAPGERVLFQPWHSGYVKGTLISTDVKRQSVDVKDDNGQTTTLKFEFNNGCVPFNSVFPNLLEKDEKLDPTQLKRNMMLWRLHALSSTTSSGAVKFRGISAAVHVVSVNLEESSFVYMYSHDPDQREYESSFAAFPAGRFWPLPVVAVGEPFDRVSYSPHTLRPAKKEQEQQVEAKQVVAVPSAAPSVAAAEPSFESIVSGTASLPRSQQPLRHAAPPRKKPISEMTLDEKFEALRAAMS